MKITSLRNWIKQHKFISSAMVHNWANNNFYLSANRAVRRMAELGELRRLSYEEKINNNLLTLHAKEIAWYEVL